MTPHDHTTTTVTHSERDGPRVPADTPGPDRAALMLRCFLLAVGETLDEAWPELIARACEYAGTAIPQPGADEFTAWLAAGLGVAPDEAAHELDELIPGLPVDTRGHGGTP